MAAGRGDPALPTQAVTDLVLPELGSYLARLAIVAVFLGAYGIPVTLHNVATVTASNSISNSVSATPGGVGVTPGNEHGGALRRYLGLDRDRLLDRPAAGYLCLGRDLAIILVSWVFGWSGGKQLVRVLRTRTQR